MRAGSGADAHRLVVDRFVLRPSFRLVRVAARGSIVTAAGMDVSRGVTTELRDEAGTLLYASTTPPQALVRTRRGLRYQGDARSGELGLRRLELRQKEGRLVVRLRAVLPWAEIAAAGRLTWALRLAEQCARRMGLACTARGRAAMLCE
jgi:hypothetical protein